MHCQRTQNETYRNRKGCAEMLFASVSRVRCRCSVEHLGNAKPITCNVLRQLLAERQLLLTLWLFSLLLHNLCVLDWVQRYVVRLTKCVIVE